MVVMTVGVFFWGFTKREGIREKGISRLLNTEH
jgi:hypothetical protein